MRSSDSGDGGRRWRYRPWRRGLDAERFVPRRARHGAALPPFLVARGAERGKINGRYAAESGYKQVEGEAIIFFKWGKWRWNALDRRDGWFYEAPPCEGSDGNLPPFEHWVTRPSLVGVAPSLSLGNYRDIKEGDVVTLAECPDFDWTGCPEGPAKRLSFSGTSWTVTVHELRGEWFYPREFPEKIAPLAGLGAVSLMGKEHCVSGFSADFNKDLLFQLNTIPLAAEVSPQPLQS